MERLSLLKRQSWVADGKSGVGPRISKSKMRLKGGLNDHHVTFRVPRDCTDYTLEAIGDRDRRLASPVPRN